VFRTGAQALRPMAALGDCRWGTMLHEAMECESPDEKQKRVHRAVQTRDTSSPKGGPAHGAFQLACVDPSRGAFVCVIASGGVDRGCSVAAGSVATGGRG